MDPLKNPFSPGAGSPPPELVGRDALLAQADILLGRILQGRSEKSILLTGLRGVGKTVLLNEIEHRARIAGYRCVSMEGSEDRALAPTIAQALRSVLFELNRLAGAGDRVKAGISALRSFIGTLKVTTNDVTFGLDVTPQKGTADSGDLETDLSQLFVAVADAAAERKTGIALFIDELQYFSQSELGALTVAMHRMQQRRLPVVLLGAGLPTLPALAGEAKSYAERLFSFPSVSALSEKETYKAIEDPARESGVVFEQAALVEIYRLTKGYPYFLQEWGYQAWNLAKTSPITLELIEEATDTVIKRLDESFFRVRYDRLTPSEKNFLRAMASLGGVSIRTGEIADALGFKISSLGPVRSKLLKKGMIFSPAHGELAFTVPLFDEFMIRAIPNFESAAQTKSGV